MKTRLLSQRHTEPIRTAARPRPARPAPQVRQILRAPRPQAKLSVSTPGDAFEREADRVAGQVMRMEHPSIQRMCSDCEAEIQAKEEPGATPAVPHGFEHRFAALEGGGEPLPASERAFFEPRFGRDFSNVRVHSGAAAGELARSVQARAFTLGDSIVLGSANLSRELLAHELTHVVQQEQPQVRRVMRAATIHSSCTAHTDILTAAFDEGERLARLTANRLDFVLQTMQSGLTPSAIMTMLIQNNFGTDIGLAPGGLTRLPNLIERFRTIERGFTTGRTLRCDLASVQIDQTECDAHSAFVIPGNRTDIFICPNFFNADVSLNSRGVTLVHEMAHSALGIGHDGGRFPTFGCEADLGLEWDQAKNNAYPYGILANCLAGTGPSETTNVVVQAPRRAAAGEVDRRWSVSASAGAELAPAAARFAGILGARYQFRAGSIVVFNPNIGVNVLYLPPGATAEHLTAATVDLGLRIQQPLRGVYFDVTGGGLAGFTVNATGATRPTAGFTGSAGLGYRWERIELGAEARALLPLTSGDSSSVLVLGRIALRLP